jgi:transcription termination factor NusB
MARRLDISALVTLIGKDKIRSELDKNIYYYNIIDRDNDDKRFPYRLYNVFERFEVPENVSPLEYLIFNKLDFLKWIIGRIDAGFISVSGRFNRIARKIIEDIDNIDEISDKYMNKIWEIIKSLTLVEINIIFTQSANYNVYTYIYDSDLNVVLPGYDERAKKFIGSHD